MANTSNLMNYELQSSNSNNYNSFQKTSSPESFPVLMENGILIKYEWVNFSTEILENKKTVNSEHIDAKEALLNRTNSVECLNLYNFSNDKISY